MKTEPTTAPAGQSGPAPSEPGPRAASRRLLPLVFAARRRRSRYRWRLRWGRPLPWPTRMEILATLVLWLAGAWGWERWESGGLPPRQPPAAVPGPATPATHRPAATAAARAALLLTAERPDQDGLFAYSQDRLAVRVPVALSQVSRPEARPDLTRARGQDPEGLRFELARVFDPRARHVDAADLAHAQAAAICRAAGAALLDATDEELAIAGAEHSAVHTTVHARLAGGKPLTVEGLTFDDPAGPVAWTLWAGYPGGDRRAAALVRASFASVSLRPLSGELAAADR